MPIYQLQAKLKEGKGHWSNVNRHVGFRGVECSGCPHRFATVHEPIYIIEVETNCFRGDDEVYGYCVKCAAACGMHLPKPPLNRQLQSLRDQVAHLEREINKLTNRLEHKRRDLAVLELTTRGSDR